MPNDFFCVPDLQMLRLLSELGQNPGPLLSNIGHSRKPQVQQQSLPVTGTSNSIIVLGTHKQVHMVVRL